MGSPAANGSRGSLEPVVRQRVRIRFRKRGDLRFLGHRDLARMLERLFRRAGLALGFSQGFHPKPRLSFPSALAVGIEGHDEVMELELAETYPAEELLERLRVHTLPGLEFSTVTILPPTSPKAQVRSVAYEVLVPPSRQAGLAERIQRLLDSPEQVIQRPGRRPLEAGRFVERVALQDGVLAMRLRVGPQGSPGPRDVLAALGLADLERQGSCLVRTAVELVP